MNAYNKIIKKALSPVHGNWQMQTGERAMLTHILRETECKVYAEVGIWYGGSLLEASSIVDLAIGIDIDPQVLGRFEQPVNCEIQIGAGKDLIPGLLNPIESKRTPSVLLIDGDHAYEGVLEDLKTVAKCVSTELIVLLHDTGHHEVRDACKDAFSEFSNIYAMDLDLVPARVIMEGGGKGEIWGGLGIFGVTPDPKSDRTLDSNFDESLRRMGLSFQKKRRFFAN
jgi:hypothetical protein